MQLIKNTGLTARWKMDEKSGTIINDSGRYKNNGTFGGGTGTNPTWASDFGLNFDSALKQIVTVPNTPSLNITNNITLECWYNCFSKPVSSGYIIAAKRQWYGELHGYAFSINADPKFVFEFGNGVASYSIIRPEGGTSPIRFNTWQNLVITYDSANFTFYLNGIQTGTKFPMVTSFATNTYPVSIGGKLGSNSYYYNGKFSDLKIYNRALSATEVSTIFNNTRTIYGV